MPQDVPEHVAAYALGINSYAQEVGWDEIAKIIDAIGMGRWTGDQLFAAANLWASKQGTNPSRLAMQIQTWRRTAARGSGH